VCGVDGVIAGQTDALVKMKSLPLSARLSPKA
jgi:hypothetical protein